MNRLIAHSALALALCLGASCALAQQSPPPLPELTPQQSADLDKRIDAYRADTQARVSRGEISPDEAARLIAWREWQIAQQIAGRAAPAPPGPMVYDSAPPDYYEPRTREYVVVEPPYYGPYYPYPAPYYGAPRSYYWGPAVCAGGFGRHFGGRICF